MRNAEATRERILEAAMEEFSAYGIAGARVDRIAKSAGCNKNMIYIYFENKETLFTTVLQKHLTRVYEDIVFTPEDLPGYARRVFDFTMANPNLMRLMAWFNLEQRTENPGERLQAHSSKVKLLAEAQNAGLVGEAFSPDFLLTLILTIATAWTAVNPFGSLLDPDSLNNTNELREATAQLVKIMVRENSADRS